MENVHCFLFKEISKNIRITDVALVTVESYYLLYEKSTYQELHYEQTTGKNFNICYNKERS